MGRRRHIVSGMLLGLMAPSIGLAQSAGLPVGHAGCEDAESFGGTELERKAYCAGRDSHFVSARTLAEQVLEVSPNSFRAHYVMGNAQHLGEANLPKALFHLHAAEAGFEALWGKTPNKANTPWVVYYRILTKLLYVHGEMDHHEQKIRYVDAISKRLDFDFTARKAWPLLKLKRFDEARRISKAAASSEDDWTQSIGLTGLCAVESEVRNRQAAYEACQAAAQRVMRSTTSGAVELSNAAAAAEEMFAFDEAERLYLEATRRPSEGAVNPWGRLVRLYLQQGRLSEAMGAWREMRAYRAARSGAHMDQQDQTEAELIGVSVLLVVGRAADAERIARRTVNRPDRQGTSSAASDQNEAGANIMDRVAKLSAARLLRAQASSAPFGEAISMRWQAALLSYKAWQSGRRAAEVLANSERLHATLRPECPGSLELPAWLDAEVIQLVGPGVALAAIRKARGQETLPEDLSGPIFDGFEAEAHWLNGDHEIALKKVQDVLQELPASAAMHRGRAAAIGADAARELGQPVEARRLYQIALADDPAVLRRLGLTLPVRLVALGQDEAVQDALDYLEDSPAFDEEVWGFVLQVGLREVRLLTSDGSVITSMQVPETESTDLARHLADSIHSALLTPDVELTQSDVKSLDGSLGSGGKAADQAKSILDAVSE